MIITIDLEYDWEGNETKSIFLINKLLDFFDNYNIKATFFVLGRLIEKYETYIKQIAKKHEIASHGFSHLNLRKADTKTLEKEVFLTKKILSELKINCVGFRSPYFLSPKGLYKILEKNGYIYDSSISKGIFLGRYYNIFLSNKPYYFNKIVEIPVSNFSILKMPLGLPFLRLAKKFNIPLPEKNGVFYMHLYELLESKPGKEIPFFYRQLYKINIGKKAWKILEEFFSRINYKFITCRDYVKCVERHEKYME
jgi:peptidoglycan/xylan/chitin deacetylase (PgdA/CDA1 family)